MLFKPNTTIDPSLATQAELKIFIWSGETSFCRERDVETCGGHYHLAMVVVEGDVFAKPRTVELVEAWGEEKRAGEKCLQEGF